MAFLDKIRSTYVFNPQSWNLYSYVNDNPVNYNDPSGRFGNVPLGTKQFRFAPPGGAIWTFFENGNISIDENLFGGQIGVIHVDWLSSVNEEKEEGTKSVARDNPFGNFEFQLGEYISGDAGPGVSPEINLYTIHAKEAGDWPHSALSVRWGPNAISWWSFGGVSNNQYGSEAKFFASFPGYSISKTTILGTRAENIRASSLILSLDENRLKYNFFINCSFTSSVIIGTAYHHPELPISGFGFHPELLLWWVHTFLPYKETIFIIPPSH